MVSGYRCIDVGEAKGQSRGREREGGMASIKSLAQRGAASIDREERDSRWQGRKDQRGRAMEERGEDGDREAGVFPALLCRRLDIDCADLREVFVKLSPVHA